MDQGFVDFLKNLHLMDIVLFATIVGFALLGFSRGMVKLGIIFIAIYVGFLLGAVWYGPFAGVVSRVFNINLSRVAEIIAFLIINIVVAALIIGILFQFFGHLEIEGRAGACLDRPMGMLLGFAAGIMLTSILVVLLEVPYEFYSEVQVAHTQAPYVDIFNEWYQNSILGPVLRQGLPVLLASISPLMGGHLPALLERPAGTGLLPPVWTWLQAGHV